MRKALVMMATAVATLSLAACSNSASSSTGSSSSDSSATSSSKSVSSESDSPNIKLPSDKAIKKAVNTSKNRNMAKMATSEENDAHIRFSDVVDSSDPNKYAGKSKVVSGTVIDSIDTQRKNNSLYFVEDVTNSKHIFVVYTNKRSIRNDDYLITHGVIAGKLTYINNEHRHQNAVMVVAKKSDVQNNGASGE